MSNNGMAEMAVGHVAESSNKRLEGFKGGEIGTEQRNAAYWAAVAIGECRIFGAELPADVSELVITDEMALAAAEQATEFVQKWTDELKTLGERFDRSQNTDEEPCVDAVEQRLEIWTALVAINEVYARTGGKSRLTGTLNKLAVAMTTYDTTLFAQRELLSVVNDAQLLNNWRMCLDQKYRGFEPWILRGILEATGRDSFERVMAAMDDPSLWEKVLAHAAGCSG